MDALQCRIEIARNVQTSVTGQSTLMTNAALKPGIKPWKMNMTKLKAGTIQRFKARASLRLCLRKRLGDEFNQTNRIVLTFVAEMQCGLQKM